MDSAPRSEVQGVTAGTPEDTEADCRAHISVENSRKGMVSLLVLGGVWMCLGLVGLMLMLGGLLTSAPQTPAVVGPVVMALPYQRLCITRKVTYLNCPYRDLCIFQRC